MITSIYTLGLTEGRRREICDPESEVTSGRSSSNMACGWSGEELLVTIKLPTASKCLSDPDKRLFLSKLLKGGGWPEVHRFHSSGRQLT